jgi:hypothetical protein
MDKYSLDPVDILQKAWKLAVGPLISKYPQKGYLARIFLCHPGGIIPAFLSLVWHLSGIPGKTFLSRK